MFSYQNGCRSEGARPPDPEARAAGMLARAAPQFSPRVARQIMLDSGARVHRWALPISSRDLRHNHCTWVRARRCPFAWSCRRTCKCALRAHHSTVSGEGQAKAVPNQAHFSAGVVSQGRKAADALSRQHARDDTAFRGAQASPGFPTNRSRRRTSRSRPISGRRTASTSAKIVGYQTSERVRVAVDDLDNLGARSRCLVSSGVQPRSAH